MGVHLLPRRGLGQFERETSTDLIGTTGGKSSGGGMSDQAWSELDAGTYFGGVEDAEQFALEGPSSGEFGATAGILQQAKDAGRYNGYNEARAGKPYNDSTPGELLSTPGLEGDALAETLATYKQGYAEGWALAEQDGFGGSPKTPALPKTVLPKPVGPGPAPQPVAEGMSTGTKVAIGVAGAAVVGLVALLAFGGKSKRRRGKRRNPSRGKRRHRKAR